MTPVRSLPTAAPALAAVLLALVCASCGSSGTPTTAATGSTAASTATKAQFIARAKSICAALSTQEKPLKARQETLKGLPVAAADKEFVALVHQLVAFSRTAATKLTLLPEPPQDAQAIKKLLNSLSVESTDATDIASAASRQESNTGEADEQALRKSIANSRTLAGEYGMKDCIGGE
jgi:hypothetical protein